MPSLFRPYRDNNICNHYNWTRRNIVFTEPTKGTKRKIVDSPRAGKIVAKGCHICSAMFKKNVMKKRCPCGQFCHKGCLGKCM